MKTFCKVPFPLKNIRSVKQIPVKKNKQSKIHYGSLFHKNIQNNPKNSISRIPNSKFVRQTYLSEYLIRKVGELVYIGRKMC